MSSLTGGPEPCSCSDREALAVGAASEPHRPQFGSQARRARPALEALLDRLIRFLVRSQAAEPGPVPTRSLATVVRIPSPKGCCAPRTGKALAEAAPYIGRERIDRTAAVSHLPVAAIKTVGLGWIELDGGDPMGHPACFGLDPSLHRAGGQRGGGRVVRDAPRAPFDAPTLALARFIYR